MAAVAIGKTAAFSWGPAPITDGRVSHRSCDVTCQSLPTRSLSFSIAWEECAHMHQLLLLYRSRPEHSVPRSAMSQSTSNIRPVEVAVAVAIRLCLGERLNSSNLRPYRRIPVCQPPNGASHDFFTREANSTARTYNSYHGRPTAEILKLWALREAE